MTIKMPYIQPRGKSFRYRRAVPIRLRETLGKTEIILSLGRNEQEMLRNYSSVHAEAERILENNPATREPNTEFEAYKRVIGRLKQNDIYSQSDLQSSELLINPDTGQEEEFFASPYSHETEELEEKYVNTPVSKIPPHDLMYIRALHGEFPEPPSVTLEDAKGVYLEKVLQDGRHTAKRLIADVNRIIGLAEAFFGKNTKLSDIRRTQARDFIADLQRSTSNSTVNRRLTTIKAVLNYAITELELNIPNPFKDMSVSDDTDVDRDKRQPFTPEELSRLWERIDGHASDALKRIWLILWGTGCRCAEVSGIGLEEIYLDHDTPHMDITPNDVRGVAKSRASRRLVPLVGKALKAVKEALNDLSSEDEYLFPKYAGDRKADAVSAALMRHVRKITKDETKVVYSLRHNAKDAMVSAGINDHLQEMIFGRQSGGVGNIYGSDNERLKKMHEALEKADLFGGIGEGE